ncbi:MAG: hypothetical protein JWN03_3713 [Nocardia sp.]|uniref:hypothetical protein n=1 Tax=Nocardia sp. TaxID=1821 RepID=UPI0026321770|nr:hypothetical protein [Nocardia sp.]MCU1643438.1 hypothetical protein [Nocardia sp.]
MAEDNALTGLRNDAHAGIFFDAAAASTMAQQCAGMLSAVDSAIGVFQRAKEVQPLNQRSSGAKLADKFNAVARNLIDTVLKDHRQVLTAMGESFGAAGQIFTGVDQASADVFKNGTFTDQQATLAFQKYRSVSGQPGLAVQAGEQPSLAVSATGQPGLAVQPAGQPGLAVQPGGQPGLAAPAGTQPGTNQSTVLAGARDKVALDSAGVEPEYSAQYEWDDFHNHWDYVDGQRIGDQLTNLAQDWLTAQTYLGSQSNTFRSATEKYLQDYQGSAATDEQVWASPAAKIAKTAVQKYLENLGALTGSMEYMSTNLTSAQSWLTNLQNHLPHKSIADTYPDTSHKAEVEQAMKAMRQAWETYYVAGVKDSSANIPILPDPRSTIAAPTAKVDTAPAQQGNRSQGGDNSNDASNPNPTTPDTTTDTTTTDQTPQSLITQAGAVIQAGIQAAQSAVEKATTAVQDGLKTGTDTAQSLLNQQLQQLGLIPGGGSPSGGSPGGGGPVSNLVGTPPNSQLFPRAAGPVTTDESTIVSTPSAGLAATTTGSSGPTEERAEFLTAGQHLGEVLGELSDAITPVAEQ